MELSVQRATAADVAPFREAYRAQAGCQIVADSAIPRGIADAFLLFAGREAVGHAGVWNRYYPGRVGEFFLMPGAEANAVPLFAMVVKASKATHIRAQTNLPLLIRMARQSSQDLEVTNFLFAEGGGFGLAAPVDGLSFAQVPNPEPNHPDSRDYAGTIQGEVVVRGGYLCHYNPPYADVHMEVEEAWRQRGIGAWFVQEVRRAALAAGKVPAARCDVTNLLSRRTLERGGLVCCGEIVEGSLRLDLR